MTSLSPAVTLTLIRQPWHLCPDITLSKVHVPCKFREILIAGRWSKIPDRRTDVRTDGQPDVYICEDTDKKELSIIFYELPNFTNISQLCIQII